MGRLGVERVRLVGGLCTEVAPRSEICGEMTLIQRR